MSSTDPGLFLVAMGACAFIFSWFMRTDTDKKEEKKPFHCPICHQDVDEKSDCYLIFHPYRPKIEEDEV